MSERTERIIIYCSVETKLRWRRAAVSSGCKNYEEFANRLLDLYEFLSEVFETQRIDEIIEKTRLRLQGVKVKLATQP